MSKAIIILAIVAALVAAASAQYIAGYSAYPAAYSTYGWPGVYGTHAVAAPIAAPLASPLGYPYAASYLLKKFAQSMAGKFFCQTKWDPALIISQIITIQLLSYSSITILTFIATSMSGYSPSIIFIFNHLMMRSGSAKLVILTNLVNALVGAYLLRVFVERSKSCLDFSLTYYFLHFIFVWLYSKSVPDTFIWYFVNIVSTCIMCVTAEILCRREEMRSIPITASV